VIHTTNYVEKPKRHTSGIIATPHVKILRFEAPLFFANISQLRARITKELSERADPETPDSSKVTFVDFRALDSEDSKRRALPFASDSEELLCSGTPWCWTSRASAGSTAQQPTDWSSASNKFERWR
jgi:MFS superfamily sulfate permease-like transporter